jgi:uncharacterized protein YbjT (DUF2867 family)
VIVVLGADGVVGGLVLGELGDRGLEARGVTASLADPASLASELRDVERMFLSEHPDPGLEVNAISVAEQLGAYHVVRLGPPHGPATDALKASSLRWTLLDAAPLMQRWLAPPPVESESPDAPVAHVDARDVAAVAALALAGEGHENTSYRLTGPEAVSDREVSAMLGVGLAEGSQAGELGDLAALLGGGPSAAQSPDVEALLGRPPRSLRQFAADHGL